MSAGADDHSPGSSGSPVEATDSPEAWPRPAGAAAPLGKPKRGTFVEVYELEPGGRPGGIRYRADPIGLLHTEAPLPAPGDIIVLPRAATSESDPPRRIGFDVLTPFRVVERQHLYVRDSNERPLSCGRQPSRYLTSWLFVRRLGEEAGGVAEESVEVAYLDAQ